MPWATPCPGFLGTVDLDNTPAGSTALNLAGQYTFTAADNGRHTFLFSNVTQAGADTLSVFAVGMPTATAPLTVVPAALSKFVFAAPASVPAGTPFSFTITAEDKFGNVETGYTGTVHFSALANDTQAVLPADYTFTAADARHAHLRRHALQDRGRRVAVHQRQGPCHRRQHLRDHLSSRRWRRSA